MFTEGTITCTECCAKERIKKALQRNEVALKWQCHAISVKLQNTKIRLCINQDQKIVV